MVRLLDVFGDDIILKGGLVLELRLERARTTKDIDLRLTGSTHGLLERLRRAGQLDKDDHLRFELQETRAIEGVGVVYGGQRFKVKGFLANKIYGDPFDLDIALADALTASCDYVQRPLSIEGFAELSSPRWPLYPLTSHIAEKLHAFTLPRSAPNTRVKDLPDLALLAQCEPLESVALRDALGATFAFRNTHALPSSLPAAPTFWAPIYERMVRDDKLPWVSLMDVQEAVASFLDPILAGHAVQCWSPERWAWSDG